MTETSQSHIDDRWDSFVMEPVPEFDGDYCYTHQTESGHMKVMSDTPDQEFILTQHANGSYEMYLPTGKVQEQVEGDYVQLIVKNNKIWIKGSSLLHIDGHANINVGKNAYVGVNGDMDVLVDGNARLTSKKTLTLQGDKVNIVAKNEISTSTKEFSFPNTTIRGDLSVNGTIHALGEIHTTSTVWSQLGFQTPGSLVVGPLAWTTPKPAMVANFVTIQTVSPILIETAVYMDIGVIGALTIEAGGATSISAGGVVDILAGGAVTIDAGGAVEIAAAGLVDISAAGAVGIAGSSVLIEPDFSVGPVLSFLAHVHTSGIPGSPTGIPYTPV